MSVSGAGNGDGPVYPPRPQEETNIAKTVSAEDYQQPVEESFFRKGLKALAITGVASAIAGLFTGLFLISYNAAQTDDRHILHPIVNTYPQTVQELKIEKWKYETTSYGYEIEGVLNGVSFEYETGKKSQTEKLELDKGYLLRITLKDENGDGIVDEFSDTDGSIESDNKYDQKKPTFQKRMDLAQKVWDTWRKDKLKRVIDECNERWNASEDGKELKLYKNDPLNAYTK